MLPLIGQLCDHVTSVDVSWSGATDTGVKALSDCCTGSVSHISNIHVQFFGRNEVIRVESKFSYNVHPKGDVLVNTEPMIRSCCCRPVKIM